MIEAGEHRDENRKPLKAEIAEVEERISRRWTDVRVHAGAVGDTLRVKLSSPFTLIGAAGLGFGIAWYYQQREPKPPDSEPRREPRDADESDRGASLMTTLLNGLNLAGMVISMLPANAASGSDAESDPR